ncbi:MAG: alanyl-tRNA editing protein, partial [Proteobacteria bacterium]|nr:alanyl-tRNA editing protein [Pseudomonadota bacterium]
MTEEIFRADAYEKQCEARVTVVDAAGIHLDRTVFYPMGGGQPGDTGILQLQDGSEIRINDTRKDAASGDIVHVPEGDIGADLVGQQVQACIDWDRRHRIMRIHTLMHLLCAVIPAGVTGGSIRDGSGRLDF